MRRHQMRLWAGISLCLLAALVITTLPELAYSRQKGNNANGDGKRADVMFVLDVTGSMQFAIDGIESGLETVLGKLAKRGIESQVGLTVYRDRDHKDGGKGVQTQNDKDLNMKEDPFTFTFKNKSHFTDTKKEFRELVKKLKAEGGGDIPENSLEAVKLAAEAKTRDKVSRIMVLITDAPPHPGKSLDKRLQNCRNALLANHYHHLYLVCKPADRELYEKIWHKEKGKNVDGVFYEISNTAAAFAGILDKIGEQTEKDVKKWLK